MNDSYGRMLIVYCVLLPIGLIFDAGSPEYGNIVRDLVVAFVIGVVYALFLKYIITPWDRNHSSNWAVSMISAFCTTIGALVLLYVPAICMFAVVFMGPHWNSGVV